MEPRLALITHNVVAMRAEPDGGSEQVSQAVNGDTVVWLGNENDYVRVRTGDGYEGWVWQGNVKRVSGVGRWALEDNWVSGAELPSAQSSNVFRSNVFRFNVSPWPFWYELPEGETPEARYVSGGIVDLYAEPDDPRSIITKLIMGTWLRVIATPASDPTPLLKVAIPFATHAPQRPTPNTDHLLPCGYLNMGDTLPASASGYQSAFSGEGVCALALRFIGTPYLWGGTTPFGFDCSGFVQRLYGLHNVVLPRDAYLQARSPLGVTVAPDQEVAAGDLVFFCGRSDPRRRGITHVGMALDAERFIHAYGKQGVVVTRNDDPAYRSAYTYVCAWRYLPAQRETGQEIE